MNHLSPRNELSQGGPPPAELPGAPVPTASSLIAGDSPIALLPDAELLEPFISKKDRAQLWYSNADKLAFLLEKAKHELALIRKELLNWCGKADRLESRIRGLHQDDQPAAQQRLSEIRGIIAVLRSRIGNNSLP